MTKLTCFKSYDIRGQLGCGLKESLSCRIGRAYAQYLNARKIVVGGNARATSEALKQSVEKVLWMPFMMLST